MRDERSDYGTSHSTATVPAATFEVSRWHGSRPKGAGHDSPGQSEASPWVAEKTEYLALKGHNKWWTKTLFRPLIDPLHGDRTLVGQDLSWRPLPGRIPAYDWLRNAIIRHARVKRAFIWFADSFPRALTWADMLRPL